MLSTLGIDATDKSFEKLYTDFSALQIELDCYDDIDPDLLKQAITALLLKRASHEDLRLFTMDKDKPQSLGSVFVVSSSSYPGIYYNQTDCCIVAYGCNSGCGGGGGGNGDACFVLCLLLSVAALLCGTCGFAIHSGSVLSASNRNLSGLSSTLKHVLPWLLSIALAVGFFWQLEAPLADSIDDGLQPRIGNETALMVAPYISGGIGLAGSALVYGVIALVVSTCRGKLHNLEKITQLADQHLLQLKSANPNLALAIKQLEKSNLPGLLAHASTQGGSKYHQAAAIYLSACADALCRNAELSSNNVAVPSAPPLSAMNR